MKYSKRKVRLAIRQANWERIPAQDKGAYKRPGSTNK